MNGPNDLRFLDPFRNDPDKAGPVPDDARLILAFQADEQGLAEYEDALYLHRTPDSDELWSAAVPGYPMSALRATGVRLLACNLRPHLGDELMQGKVAEAARRGAERDAAAALLEAYVSAVSGFSRVNSTIAAGILGPRDLEQCLVGIRKGWQRRSEAARLRAHRLPPIIIAAARELGLNPEPAGAGVHAWWADCPGTGHRLKIGTESGQFGCGYCNRKGGVAELRAFVDGRRARDGRNRGSMHSGHNPHATLKPVDGGAGR